MSARPTSRRIARRGMAVAAYTLALIALAAIVFSGGSEGAPPAARPAVEPHRHAPAHPPKVVRRRVAPRHDARRRVAPHQARRVIPPVALDIDHQGAGDGTVLVLGGARCSGDCTIDITRGRVITLTAHAPAGARFDGWTAPAACRGTPACDVQVRDEMTVAARFSAVAPRRKHDRTQTTGRSRKHHRAVTRVLITSVTGDARLRVRGRGTCARGCTFRRGALVKLRVTHAARAGVQWAGARCDGDTCTVRMTRNRAITATISDPPPGRATWHATHPNQAPGLTAVPTPTPGLTAEPTPTPGLTTVPTPTPTPTVTP